MEGLVPPAAKSEARRPPAVTAIDADIETGPVEDARRLCLYRIFGRRAAQIGRVRRLHGKGECEDGRHRLKDAIHTLPPCEPGEHVPRFLFVFIARRITPYCGSGRATLRPSCERLAPFPLAAFLIPLLSRQTP